MTDRPTPTTPERIVDHRLIEEMQDSYLTYSMSVITARSPPAVPVLRGCVPVVSL